MSSAPAPAPEVRDFFVSFTYADVKRGEWIDWQLEAAGYSVYFQNWGFRPGENFIAKMRTLAVLSPEYLRSFNCILEWAPALQHKQLLLVRIKKRRALAIDEKSFGPDHPNVAVRANNIGTILKAQGDLEGAALAYTRRALAIRTKFLGPDHPRTRMAAGNLAVIERSAKR